jgi:hypothetical protein
MNFGRDEVLRPSNKSAHLKGRWRNCGINHVGRTYGSNKSSAAPTSGVSTFLFLTFQDCGFENGEGF